MAGLYSSPLSNKNPRPVIVTRPELGSLRLAVSCLHRIHDDIRQFGPAYLVSLVDPHLDPERMPKFDSGRHHIFRLIDYNDVRGEDVIRDTVHRLPKLADQWLTEASALEDGLPILVHCHVGAGRSPAATYILLACMLGPGREQEAFDELLRITRKPWPNIEMTQIADGLLARGGALAAPLENYRTSHRYRHMAYRRLYRIGQ